MGSPINNRVCLMCGGAICMHNHYQNLGTFNQDGSFTPANQGIPQNQWSEERIKVEAARQQSEMGNG